MDISEERLERFRTVAALRQPDLGIVLENVHDPHNIGAVLRSCDSVGVVDVYILYTEPALQERGLDIGLKSASGAKKWLNIHYFEDLDKCMTALKEKYQKLYGTILSSDAVDLYDVDFCESCAVIFGNERDGVSKAAEKYIDQNIIIPQQGFVQSLNISVACAVTLFEAMRQRRSKGMYNGLSTTEYSEIIYQEYLSRDIKQKSRGLIEPKTSI